MPNQPTIFPVKIFARIVIIVFVAELLVMFFLLPLILPQEVDIRLESIVDSCLLTMICGPLLWFVVIGPLRQSAKAEQMAVIAQMATGVAHELRNPLTSIKLLVQTNREAVEMPVPMKQDLQIVENEIRRMERSLQAFLEFGRPRKPQLQRVDIRMLIHRIFNLIEQEAAQKRVALQFSIPDHSISVRVDEEQMQQLLLNLALNAMDAMPQGGMISVDVRSLDQSIQIIVSDSGEGIASEIQPQLFQPFVTSKATGVGLGLVVCRRIAEDHGGSLTASNQDQGGARFTLVLPIDFSEADATQLSH